MKIDSPRLISFHQLYGIKKVERPAGEAGPAGRRECSLRTPYGAYLIALLLLPDEASGEVGLPESGIFADAF